MIISGLVILFLMYAMAEVENKNNMKDIITFSITGILFSPLIGALNPGSYIVGVTFGWISYKIETFIWRISIQILTFSISIMFIYCFLELIANEGFLSWRDHIEVFLSIVVLGTVNAFLHFGIEKLFERKRKNGSTAKAESSYLGEAQLQETTINDKQHKMVSTLFTEQNQVVQINTLYYNSKWGSVQNPEKNNTWNWMALLFPVFWLAYRKMYKVFLMFGIIGTLGFLPLHISDNPIWGYIGGLFYLVMAITVGRFGNQWYYNHASKVLKQAKILPSSQQDSYLQRKGGTHIGIMIGLSTLLYIFYFVADIGFYMLPTKTNVKDVVRMSDEGFELESLADEPKWKYIKKEDNHQVVEYTGYHNKEKENVRIVFYIHFLEGNYEWKQVYLNGRKLSKKEVEDYKLRIADELSY